MSSKHQLICLPAAILGLLVLLVSGLTQADNKKDCRAAAVIGNHGSHGCQHADELIAYDHGAGLKRGLRLSRLAKVLDLTEAQEGAFKAFMHTQHQNTSSRHQAIKARLLELEQLELGGNAYIAKAQAIGVLHGQAMAEALIERAHVEGQIVDLLTPEQLQQFQQVRDEMAHKWLQQMQN